MKSISRASIVLFVGVVVGAACGPIVSRIASAEHAAAAPSQVRTPPSQGSYIWWMNTTDEVIPSGKWTTLTWNWPVVDVKHSHDARHPDRVSLHAGFLDAAVVDVAWQQNGHGIRSVRFMGGGQAVAQNDYPALNVPSQHTQASMQPGVPAFQYFTVQVLQTSGQPLRIVRDGLQSPSLMVANLTN
jgi:hypothetical protein